MIPAIVTKTYRFDGGPEDQLPVISYVKSFAQENGVALNINQYADSLVMQFHGMEDQFEDFDDSKFIAIKAGTPKWKYEFELPHEILIELMPAPLDVIRLVEIKIGCSLKQLDKFIFVYEKPKETRRTFETRMLRELTVVNDHFIHEGKKYRFSMVDNTKTKIEVIEV